MEREYPRDSVDRQAEEVFASVCEVITPERFHRAPAGQAAFAEVCQERARPMTAQDLVDVATLVADGLHRKERRQQIFPVRDNDQFCEGTFVGPILAIEGHVATQRINRQGEVVMHSREVLASPVAPGALVEISYKDGHGQVHELCTDRGVGR